MFIKFSDLFKKKKQVVNPVPQRIKKEGDVFLRNAKEIRRRATLARIGDDPWVE